MLRLTKIPRFLWPSVANGGAGSDHGKNFTGGRLSAFLSTRQLWEGERYDLE
jgi:hypothetical protein